MSDWFDLIKALGNINNINKEIPGQGDNNRVQTYPYPGERQMKTHYIKTASKNPYQAVDKTKIGKQIITNMSGKVLKVVTVCGEGKTDQSFKEMTSVKALVART